MIRRPSSERPADGVCLWLVLLEEGEEWERLYEAAGIAFALLDPADPTTDQAVLTKAVLARATAAHELDFDDEAVATYEKAMARLEAEEPPRPGNDLAEAMSSVAVLLTELGREDEAAAAWARLFGRFKLPQRVMASNDRKLEKAAQAWLDRDGDLSSTRASESLNADGPLRCTDRSNQGRSCPPP